MCRQLRGHGSRIEVTATARPEYCASPPCTQIQRRFIELSEMNLLPGCDEAGGPGQGSLIWSVGQGAVVWMPQQPVQVSSYGAAVARSATWKAAGSVWSGGGVHSAVPVVSIPGERR